MTVRRLLPTLAFLLAAPLAADVLPFDVQARRLYALRLHTDGTNSFVTDDQALWSFDPVQEGFERLAPFKYRGLFSPAGRVQLGAHEDRIVIQGSDHFELDVASGRFLRRYEAMRDGSNPGWAFRGAIVPESIATKLRVEPGIYGFAICPPSSGTSGYGCSGSVSVEGLTEPLNQNSYDVLLYRSLDPGRPELRLVNRFEKEPATTLWRRFIAVDPDRNRFLIWSTSGLSGSVAPVAHDLTALTRSAGGTFGENRLLREIDPDTRHYRQSEDFAFVPRANTAFHAMYQVEPAWSYLLTMRPLSTLMERTIAEVERSSFVRGTSIFTDAITGLPGTLPATYEQLIPIVGETRGAHGTHWRSDLWLFNPSNEPAEIELRRVVNREAHRIISLPAHGSLALANILRELGGGSDGVTMDAVVITSPYRWGAQLSAYSRTYTPSTEPGQEGGTFGQAVPAVPTRIGYTNHVREFRDAYDSPGTDGAQLVLDRETPGQYRHNLGVVNDDDEPLTVRLRSLDPTERSFRVDPHSVANVNLEALFPEPFPRILLAADRPAAVWVSMIDNITGDASFIPFSLFSLRGVPDSHTAIPGVARTAGANGTFWMTDLYGVFPGTAPGESATFPRARLRANGCGSDEAALMGAGIMFRDVARLAGCQREDVLGALELRVASWTAGFSRTYTTRPDGGTYGEMLPFYPHAGWPVQHFAGVQINDHFRANIGLYNGMNRPVTYTLRLYGQDGTLAREATKTLAAKESRQSSIETWFEGLIPTGLYGLTVIPQDEPESQGRSWAYVSIVDNITNDPTNWW